MTMMLMMQCLLNEALTGLFGAFHLSITLSTDLLAVSLEWNG